jgi:hypothetical protein
LIGVVSRRAWIRGALSQGARGKDQFRAGTDFFSQTEISKLYLD